MQERWRVLAPRSTDANGPVAAVVHALAVEFDGIASADIIADVVLQARRDLDHDVPLASLDEFLHRLAHQRLLDACGEPAVKVSTGGMR